MSRSRNERLSIVSSFVGRRAGLVPASDGLLKSEKIEPVPRLGPFPATYFMEDHRKIRLEFHSFRILNSGMNEITGLPVFVQVAEMQSFVAAGRILGISASAVGKSIARLEERLGVRLFHRSTRSMRLTQEGLIFLDRCRRILSELKSAELELLGAIELPRGRLRVSLPLASGLLLPLICDFMEQYSDVELDLNFTNRNVDLIEEGFDLAIRVGALDDSRLMARRCTAFRLILVASPEYVARRGCPNKASDLSNHDCLHFRFVRSGKVFKWPISAVPGAPDIRLPTRLTTNENMMLIQAAKRGLGIACVPDFTVREALASGTLRTFLEREVSQEIVWWAVWPASPHTSPKLSVFVDFLSQRLQNTSDHHSALV
jgi:DNA-binding transcriptional LysR family regulator